MAVVGMMTYGLCAQAPPAPQTGTVSPYSFFGIGDLNRGRTVENQMMGGLSIFPDSIRINLKNPAAYGKLLLTTYAIGASHQEISLETSAAEENSSITDVDYLAIGLPLGKGLGIGFGITPFSDVGYNFSSTVENSNGELVNNVFSGEGGINNVYFAIGYQIAKNISIGGSASFNFGTLEYRRLQSVEDVQFGTLDRRSSRINGLGFSFSALYTPKISEKLQLLTSFTADLQDNLSSDNTAELGSFLLTNGADVEVSEVDLEAVGLRRTDIKLPTTYALGLGLGEINKWFFGAEYSFQELEGFSNDFLPVSNVVYQNASNISVGGFFIPDYSSFSGYLKRVTYRAGIRYAQSGLVVNNEEIDDFGITFGFGLPLGNNTSNVNIGFEIGKRGTTDANLVEENYFQVNISLSLNDRWFKKRKIN